MRNSLLTLFILFCSLSALSQPSQKLVRVAVTPNSADWNYKLGEKAKFNVLVTQNGIQMQNVNISYELSHDMLPPFKKEATTLKDGKIEIDGGTMKDAGFLRCRVFVTHNNVKYEGRGTAGFAPESIKPTTQMPSDFQEFWNKAKEENAKIPMDARLTLLPEKCTEKSNVYEINLQNFRQGSRLYGILSVPKAPGKYPATLRVPGAGVRPYNGDPSSSDRGIISLEIGIHGIPVTLKQGVYDNLRAGALNGYQNQNWENRDNVYYKRVFMGCVRAIDYIFSMKEFNGNDLLIYGGSQGGALSIITAALDERVKGLISFYPAMSDMNGYLHGRAGGWPHYFKNLPDEKSIINQKEKTAQYYDVVNFARLVKVPVFYAFGYNDMVCPPTTSFAVYNVISSPKKLLVVPEIEHYAYPEMWSDAWKWSEQILRK
ncbi:acetylxylan esterase [Dysgonomonas sp. 520]|uniref:acetylxylan esterase n=1 Tax=Dysgonomonas sp. 520 TaxID=2302931 RepID=UPI0013D2BD9F|nr:acetylxylan esterase [Dysgonomonas sp. 520]NDW10153.1 acetylxylan esterase [Dysgonomonas sp. 520]